MHHQTSILKWGTDYLVANGYSIEGLPKTVLSTPWSAVIRFVTSAGDIYLKKTPASMYLSNEPKIMQLLSEQFNASVPVVIANNNVLHCFLMRDAGKPLRETLKAEFKLDLLCQAINQFAAIQRSTEEHVDLFLKLGVLDWRLDKLPILYNKMINLTDFLKREDITDQELQILKDLSPKFLAQCRILSDYGIPETLGYHDFHDKNVLFDSNTKIMTFVDWSETAIIHPFFSLYNFLQQSVTHHGIKENDEIYRKLQDTCFENWLELAKKKQFLEMFPIIKKLWFIYSALACYQCMINIDLQAYKAFYPNKPSQFTKMIRGYIRLNSRNL